ncbi:MAG: 3-hydroxy-3-methylglutaryl CoA reductase [Chthoniobacteraceae bacterium]|nr:3-hydroxy-3-methylglutaryl CoA reductase [Chthoniobacteraceae bacterium]
MPTNSQSVGAHLKRMFEDATEETLRNLLSSKTTKLPPRVPGASLSNPEAVERRWKLLPNSNQCRDELFDPKTRERHAAYGGNIENFIGTVKIPVGIAGPLRVNGLHAQGDYYLPLATTEAALVASYHRGAIVISESGGCTALLLAEGVSRAPGFAFKSLIDVGVFITWALTQIDAFKKEAEATTRHGKLADMRVTVEGNHVYLNFEFLTGDAAGQNMVTIATQAICDFIKAHTPVTPDYFFVESNFSGDKKASAQSFQSVRGRKISAEVNLSAELIARRLHTTARAMENYWRMSALGGVLSGTIGVQGHYANGLTALYIATGQDAACVSESAVGITRFEALPDNSLYAAVTLPNLIVGTVGGGTKLPSQSACLELLGLNGTGHARAFAEVAAALALAGEISIIAALSAHQFTGAHAKLARGTQP